MNERKKERKKTNVMNRFPKIHRRIILAAILFFQPFLSSLDAADKNSDDDKVEPGKRGVIRFSESPIQSSDKEQVALRLSAAESPPDFDITQEEFEILVPEDYDPRQPHGLFIWISAGKNPTIPADWEPVLAENKLIFIGARNSGNPRNIFDRIRLAIDANHGLRQKYNIDGRRVYLSGFSGGARVASMAGVAWAEMFSGTICFMGVNFYTDIEAEDGKLYGLNYLPDDTVVGLAKQHCRYVLVTGEKDFNRPNTRGVYENGFQKEGFEHIKLIDIPQQGHTLPAAKSLQQAIEFLDEGKPPAPVSE
jgi:predicted esterase